jgi:threonine dehydratase
MPRMVTGDAGQLVGRRSSDEISEESIDRAAAAGRGIIEHTPVLPATALRERVGGDIWLKAENLQRTGSFKLRGALSKLAALGPAAAKGVTAGSAGNHAQAIALAAHHADVRCEIFVPAGAPITKIEACLDLGAEVEEGGDSVDEAMAAAVRRADAAGMAFCHPFDDADVIAGQATLGRELLGDLGDLRRVIVPLGGGGLSSGVAVAIKRRRPDVQVYGVQAEVCAPYLTGATSAGPIVTLADGIAVKRPGALTDALVRLWLDGVVAVDEDAIADAMVMLLERSKLCVEGAGAVGVAALLTGALAPAEDGSTCVVLSGGNVDLGVLPALIRRQETSAGRRLFLFVRLSDRPGTLAKLLGIFADQSANLLHVEHVREGVDLHVRETGVEVVLEVRGREHAERILGAVAAAGYEFAELGHR